MSEAAKENDWRPNARNILGDTIDRMEGREKW
jgi:hypothetical protein